MTERNKNTLREEFIFHKLLQNKEEGKKNKIINTKRNIPQEHNRTSAAQI